MSEVLADIDVAELAWVVEVPVSVVELAAGVVVEIVVGDFCWTRKRNNRCWFCHLRL